MYQSHPGNLLKVLNLFSGTVNCLFFRLKKKKVQNQKTVICSMVKIKEKAKEKGKVLLPNAGNTSPKTLLRPKTQEKSER